MARGRNESRAQFTDTKVEEYGASPGVPTNLVRRKDAFFRVALSIPRIDRFGQKRVAPCDRGSLPLSSPRSANSRAPRFEGWFTFQMLLRSSAGHLRPGGAPAATRRLRKRWASCLL